MKEELIQQRTGDRRAGGVGSCALSMIAGVLGACCLYLFGFLATLYVVGTNDGLYYALQMRAEILTYAGVDEPTLRMLDAALADCLRGDADWNGDANGALQCIVFGREQQAFNDREILHMEDCRRLFRLLRFVLAGTGIVSLVFVCLSAVHATRKRRRSMLSLGGGIILLILGSFSLWAIVDFDTAFTFFHNILFTNDLWLLDPRTDLLIRLCPESMFMEMGGLIAAAGFLWCVLWSGLMWHLRGRKGIDS